MNKNYQIFDSQWNLILDTKDFEKAVRTAKTTPYSLIKVQCSVFINKRIEDFEFSFESPDEHASDDSIQTYIDLRVEDEMQKLVEKLEGEQENDEPLRKSGRI